MGVTLGPALLAFFSRSASSGTVRKVATPTSREMAR